MVTTPRGADLSAEGSSAEPWPLSLSPAEAHVLAQLVRAQALAFAGDEHFRERCALSQNDLVAGTRAAGVPVSQSSVSRALGTLESSGTIELGDLKQLGRGPATQRWQVTDQGYVMGINLQDDFGIPGRLHGVATTLDGRALASTDENLGADSSIEAVRDHIATLVGRLRHKVEDDDPKALLGVAVSLGGHVRDGRVIRSNLGWAEEVDLRKELQHALFRDGLERIAVIVENNANCFAASLNPSGGPAQWRVTVIVDHRGIGCGLYLGDQLWVGDFSKAGEIGHMPTLLQLVPHGCVCPEDGPYNEQCRYFCQRCHKHGCLETIATPQAIVDALKAAGYTIDSIEQAAELLEQDDQVARRVFEFAGKALGYALVSVALTIDPERLRLYGRNALVDPDTASGKVYLGAMETVLDRHGFSAPRVRVEPHPHPNAESIQEQAAFAAAGDVVQRFLAGQATP